VFASLCGLLTQIHPSAAKSPEIADALNACGLSRRVPLHSPKIFKSRRRQFGVAHGVLNVLVAQVRLEGPRIMPLIGQRIAAGVTQHVRMNLKVQLSLDARPFDHARKPGCREGAPAFGCKHERRFRLLLALLSPAVSGGTSPIVFKFEEKAFHHSRRLDHGMASSANSVPTFGQ
jgi:hypothetical protein